MDKRRIFQIVSLFFLHSSSGWEAKWFCLPVLSCHSCSLSWFACPIGVFIHYNGYRVFPFLALGTVLLLATLGGRLLCGWVCPFGLLQDVMYKIRSPKFRLPRWTSWMKYVVLFAMVFLFPLLQGEYSLYSFCRICPASAIQVTLPNLVGQGFQITHSGTAIKLGILGAILILVTFSSRAFCKTMCPLGALLAPFNLISFWRVRPATTECISCHRCDKICPTDARPSVKILESTAPNRAPECIACHDCQAVCPKAGE